MAQDIVITVTELPPFAPLETFKIYKNVPKVTKYPIMLRKKFTAFESAALLY